MTTGGKSIYFHLKNIHFYSTSSLNVFRKFDIVREMKRLCVTGETRSTVREHIVSQPFAWAGVREVFLTSFCLLGGDRVTG